MPGDLGSSRANDSPEDRKTLRQDAGSRGSPGSARGTSLEPAQAKRASSKSPRRSVDSTSRTANASGQRPAVTPRPSLSNPFRAVADSRNAFLAVTGPPKAVRSQSDVLPEQSRSEAHRNFGDSSTVQSASQAKPNASGSTASRSSSSKDQAMAKFENQTRLAIRDHLATRGNLDALSIQAAPTSKPSARRSASFASQPSNDSRGRPRTQEEKMEKQTSDSLGEEYRALLSQHECWEEVAMRVGARCHKILGEMEAQGSAGGGTSAEARERNEKIEGHVRSILTELTRQCERPLPDYM